MNRIKAGKAVLNMALDAIGGADDVARAAGKAVKAPKAAAAKALDAIADTADDWGWKGGKPGEITGGEFVQKLERSPIFGGFGSRPVRDDEVDLLRAGIRQLEDAAKRAKPIGRIFEQEVEDLRSMGHSWQSAKNLAAMSINREFASLEAAGVGRSLTGATAGALRRRGSAGNVWDRWGQLFPAGRDVGAPGMHGGKPVWTGDTYRTIGKELEVLNPSQRETFLALLPDWTGTLDGLAEAAKALG